MADSTRGEIFGGGVILELMGYIDAHILQNAPERRTNFGAIRPHLTHISSKWVNPHSSVITLVLVLHIVGHAGPAPGECSHSAFFHKSTL